MPPLAGKARKVAHRHILRRIIYLDGVNWLSMHLHACGDSQGSTWLHST